MTLGRMPGPCHQGPGRPHPDPACLSLSQLTRPQHCLSDRPVLGPHGQLHFPRWLPACPSHQLTGSPGPEGARWALLLLPDIQGPSPGFPLC